MRPHNGALEFFDQWDPKPPLGLPPYAYDLLKAMQLLAEAGYPEWVRRGRLLSLRALLVETFVGYFGTLGISMKARTMERASFQSSWSGKKLSGGRCSIPIRGRRWRTSGRKRSESSAVVALSASIPRMALICDSQDRPNP